MSGTWAKGLNRPHLCVRDDHHGKHRLLDYLAADRARHQPGDPMSAARAEDDQVGIARRFDKLPHGQSRSRHGHSLRWLNIADPARNPLCHLLSSAT